MPVLVIAETVGVTGEVHDGMLERLGAELRRAPGFIAHLAGPKGDRWQVLEVWETKEAATHWFAEFVRPNLPPEIKPKRTIYDLHAVVIE